MTPVFLTDLDDTLFQTRRKIAEPTAGLKLMSTLIDGSPSGFATPKQQALLGWMSLGQVVPVTARSTGVLARVDVPQAPAICSNGGCIIGEDGALDRDWHDRLASEAAADHAVHDVYRAVTDALDDRFRHWVVEEHDLPLYIVIKSNADSDQDLIDLAERRRALLPPAWREHSNGNNLAYMPGWLNKRHAVAYLIERLRADAPDTPILGVGDSLSDVGFMDLCDYAITPTDSQFWQAATRDNAWLA